MNYPWFRMYSEAVDDDKLGLLAFEDRWHFVAILCLKSAGTLDSGAPMLERRVAKKLGLQVNQLEEVKRRLMEVGLIDENYQPISWGKRQFKSDHDAADRKRKQRERDSHNHVTTDDRDSPTLDSESESESESDTETEQEGAEALEVVEGLDEESWKRWEAYRRKRKKPIKPESVLAAKRKLAGFGSSQAAVVENSIAEGYQGLIPPKNSGNGSHQPPVRSPYRGAI